MPTTVFSLLAAVLPLLASCLEQNLDIAINERPHFIGFQETPTPVYVTLSVMFLGDINEAESSFSLDAFVDVAWRDDRLGPGSGQAFGCTPPTVGVMLLSESFAPSFCPEYCIPDSTPWCYGYAAPTPWSPFLEVTNIAPQFNGMALSYPTAYVSAGAPSRLRLSDPNGTWVTGSARFYGPMLKVYPLQDFPYDKQRLDVHFESTQWSSSDVELIASFDAAELKSTILSSKSMLGWDVQDVTLAPSKVNYTQLGVAYNRITMSVTVTRQPSPYAQRYILPGFLIIIMMLSASISAGGPVRVANGVAGFASILYLQFILTSTVPPLNYATRLDKFFLTALVICFVACVVGAAHVYRETLEKAAKGGGAKTLEGGGSAAVPIREPARGGEKDFRAPLQVSPPPPLHHPSAGGTTFPAGFSVDASGNLFASDSISGYARKMSPGGPVSPNSAAGSSGTVLLPVGIAVDRQGVLHVAPPSARPSPTSFPTAPPFPSATLTAGTPFPSIATGTPPMHTLMPLQVCLARFNPFAGGIWEDLVCYGVIFITFSTASACVLLV